jgi:hypothetical protein
MLKRVRRASGFDMSDKAVADVVWEILKRPRHRARWEDWSRPGATGQRHNGDEYNGAQSCVAWVVCAHREGEEATRAQWSEPNSTPHRRSAIQRFFSQGASRHRRKASKTKGNRIEDLTRSVALIDIVNAFAFSSDELSEVCAAWGVKVSDSQGHMGRSVHAWETARTDDDLRDVVELSRRLIGGTAGFKRSTGELPTDAEIAPLRRRLDQRADALELCVRHRLDDPDEILVGYFLAYPLTARATADILAGRITSAEQFTDDQVATSFTGEDSLYIGMVLGADWSARVSVMGHCIQRLTKWMGAHPDGYLFAKRSTEDGERWLTRQDFRPVTDTDGIWMRDPALPAVRRKRSRRRLIATAT